MNGYVKSAVAACAAGLVLVAFVALPQQAQPARAPASKPEAAAPAAQKSLYDRLGGAYAISAVVDDFVERLLADKVITANKDVMAAFPSGHKPGLRFLVTVQICQVTGGPYTYHGKSMKDAHASMHITDKEWDAMVVDLKATLDQFKVPATEQGELIGLLATTKADIVTAPAPAR